MDVRNRLARGGDAVNTLTDQDAKTRPSWEELEGSSFEELSGGLTDVTITRSRAIKLAGAALAGSALTILWPAEADARRRRRKRRRRQAQAPPTVAQREAQASPEVVLVPGNNTVNVTNPGDTDLTIESVTLLDSNGEVISTEPLVGGPVTIQAGDTLPVTFEVDAADLVNADELRLIEEGGLPITVVDENGVTVGDIDVL